MITITLSTVTSPHSAHTGTGHCTSHCQASKHCTQLHTSLRLSWAAWAPHTGWWHTEADLGLAPVDTMAPYHHSPPPNWLQHLGKASYYLTFSTCWVPGMGRWGNFYSRGKQTTINNGCKEEKGIPSLETMTVQKHWYRWGIFDVWVELRGNMCGNMSTR